MSPTAIVPEKISQLIKDNSEPIISQLEEDEKVIVTYSPLGTQIVTKKKQAVMTVEKIGSKFQKATYFNRNCSKKEMKKIVNKLYRDGYTQNEIATKIGKSQPYVSRIINEE